MMTSHSPGLPKDFDKAVRILLSEPARPLLVEIQNSIRADSQYLFYHDIGVGIEIDRLLQRFGLSWSSQEFDRFRFPALRIALERMTQRKVQPHS
jgi:hypothetical protein